MPFVRSLRSAVLLVAGAVLVAGCGSGSTPAAPEAKGTASAGFPVRLDANCGQRVEVAHPPRRAVALDQGSAEILLSLGLADRMVGTGTWTDPVLKGLEKANAAVPRLSDQYPSFETVLDTEPDFVSATFLYTLGKGGVAPRDRFAKLGVPTYLSPTDCVGKDNSGDGDGIRNRPLTMDVVYGEIRDLSRIFDVPERGEKLVGELRARVAKAKAGADFADASVLYWYSDSQGPYMAGCCGAPGIVSGALGVRNVFDDTKEEWPQINWETVVDRDPDVLVIGDLTRETQSAESAAKKIEFLESHPVTRNMTAVRKKRYVILSGQALNPTIRTVEGIEKVAAALRTYGLAK
ncbi:MULTISPECIES: ABC transporter substrate-binding protein [unclassified Streptomyces]|uniref:ABC transporter substrate-binding protein n=1 Tax=unclassified Streptomyces TaxID=2593676 RepID=UPI001660E5B0|nr:MULTISPECIES: ABC transporter substrate-binding protein [unclassified Streptomyces]MBD0710892.1 ABC transporter substrate-binding protein [Streptomyces sp. CBMA291]MBD0713373.1 ABC transporter substrate-binding protein [Streptomyces sp. CBMA370]